MNMLNPKQFMGGLLFACASLSLSTAVFAGQLPAADAGTNTYLEKSVISGHLLHDANNNLLYDNNGQLRFQYTGKIFVPSIIGKTGLINDEGKEVGSIQGEAAFPPAFAYMSAAINKYVSEGDPSYMPPYMPAVIPWTCNSCVVTLTDGTKYVSIVDALNPASENYQAGLAAQFDAGIAGGSAAVFNDARMDGRAFTNEGLVHFDPVNKIIGIHMAGCSEVFALSGPDAGHTGVLCMNAVLDLNFGQAHIDTNTGFYTADSNVPGNGSSNCVVRFIDNPVNM